MTLKHYTDVARHFGMSSAFFDLGYRALNRKISGSLVEFLLLTESTLNREALKLPQGYEARFATRDELLKVASIQDSPSEELFIKTTIERGDRAYAIYYREAIVSVGYYATCATEIYPGVWVDFPSHFLFRYRGFTLPEYRGDHLHACGIASSFVELFQQGVRGLVSHVELNNFRSLRSCKRVGYKTLGYGAYRTKRAGQVQTWISSGSKAHGISLNRY